MIHNSTINSEEVNKFDGVDWWNLEGKMRILHEINLPRLEYICHNIEHYHGNLAESDSYEIIDVGCGGGILTESLAQAGYSVVGIDALESNIKAAQKHLLNASFENKISYICSDIESLEQNKQYDVICAMEIIEHVNNVEFFIQNLASRLKPGGLLFLSTLNRNVKSYLLGIVMAEYVLRWVDRGTHDWKKFISPNELADIASNYSLKLENVSGLSYSILSNMWEISTDDSVNYMCVFQKEGVK